MLDDIVIFECQPTLFHPTSSPSMKITCGGEVQEAIKRLRKNTLASACMFGRRATSKSGRDAKFRR
jgi:hypothetical protein